MMVKRTITLALAFGGIFLSSAASAQEDPGATGPHPVTVVEYSGNAVDLGCDSNGANCSIPGVEFQAQVHHPSGLSNGPFPIVVMIHGRHPTCYDTTTGEGFMAWPCTSGRAVLPNYKGYDYIASLLASHGIIAVSISANGINARDDMVGGGYIERAELIQRHLDRWAVFNTTGAAPFGTSFVGLVSLGNVGTMGHSRGGRAVVQHLSLNASLGAPYGIRAVLPLAPIRNTESLVVNNVPLAVMLGYCDGDTDVDGVRYFDASRYNVATDTAPKYVMLGMGANHNFFNRYWTRDQFAPGTCCSANPPTSCDCAAENSCACVSRDDWARADPSQTDAFCGRNAVSNGRLTSAEQRAFAKAYVAAFFRKHLTGANQFDPLLQGDALPPPSAGSATVYQSYFPPTRDRRDLNRIVSSDDLSSNAFSGVTAPTAAAPAVTGLAQYSLCGPGTSSSGGFTSCVTTTSREPHSKTVLLELGWPNTSASYSNLLPVPNRDVSNFSTLQFRVGVDYSDSRNTAAQAQDFSIRLADNGGRTSTVRASDYSDVLYYPPGTGNHRASVLSTLRIPMNALLDVDITAIKSVDLIFDRKPTGGIMVSDITFAGEGMTVAEKWLAANAGSF